MLDLVLMDLELLQGILYFSLVYLVSSSSLLVYCFVTARIELRKFLFLAPSVCGFLFVHEMEPPNRFAPNS